MLLEQQHYYFIIYYEEVVRCINGQMGLRKLLGQPDRMLGVACRGHACF